jgi:hypothetical protein
MKRQKNKKTGRKPLSNGKGNPIGEVRVMQINSATTTLSFAPISGAQSTSAATATSSTNSDQAVLNMSSTTFARLVQDAKSYPEVRNEVVAAYQSQVASGHYPPPDVISGLASLLSGASD